MKLSTFSAGFLALYLAIGAATLAAYRAPPLPAVPAKAGDDLVDYGLRLVSETFAHIGPNVSDPQRRFAGNNLACQNCHLDAGLKPAGLPLTGTQHNYPKFSTRAGRVISLIDRVNECMTRSMNGHPLPENSREMAAFLTYMRSIDKGGAVQEAAAPESPLPPDTTRGAEVFARVCANCHQPDGLGVRVGAVTEPRGYQFPPVWGPDSFNDGAGMDRFDRAVGFILRNMPRGIDPANPQLSLQEAWDVAAYLQAQPRPHFVNR